jgi:RNA polymerase sigma-70 factor (ECF subfamily)
MADVGQHMQHCMLRARLTNAASTNEALVAEAKSGDRSAFVELWRRHSKIVFRAAYRIMRNREDTEDVVQDVWLKAYVHLNAFDGRAQFETWLRRIAINASLMILRRRRARPESPMQIVDGEGWRYLDIADRSMGPEEGYTAHESATIIRKAISRLPPNLREVIEIYHSNDHSLVEIANLAGISVAATKGRLFRAKRILRKTLDRSGKTGRGWFVIPR